MMTDYPLVCQPCEADQSPTKTKIGVVAVSCKWKQLPSWLLAGFPWARVLGGQNLFKNLVDFSTFTRTRKAH